MQVSVLGTLIMLLCCLSHIRKRNKRAVLLIEMAIPVAANIAIRKTDGIHESARMILKVHRQAGVVIWIDRLYFIAKNLRCIVRAEGFI